MPSHMRDRCKSSTSDIGDVKHCSRCGKQTVVKSRYCREHHAEYMRGWRKTHPYSEMSEGRKRKVRARAYARVYLTRGLIKRAPCVVADCTAEPEMHHADYAKPLEVTWICRPHHLALHRGELPIPMRQKAS